MCGDNCKEAQIYHFTTLVDFVVDLVFVLLRVITEEKRGEEQREGRK